MPKITDPSCDECGAHPETVAWCGSCGNCVAHCEDFIDCPPFPPTRVKETA